MPPIYAFATWEPLLRLLRTGHPEVFATPGRHVAGFIGRYGWSVPLPSRFAWPSGAAEVQRVRDALEEAGLDRISYVAERSSTGRTVLSLFTYGPAVEETAAGAYPGSLVLREGAVPEPWRRLPTPAPAAVAAPSADPALLERTLRERIPGGTGATETEIADAEARLGIALPDELKAVYRVTRAHRQDWLDDPAAAEHVITAVGVDLLPLDEVYIADAASRPRPWEFAAMEAAVTAADAAVQGLVGSPGWIAFGDNGGGDRFAIDLTPGPRGHLGQVIILDHEQNIGAGLVADSLTDWVRHQHPIRFSGHGPDQPPVVARVNVQSLTSIDAAAHPALEVLSIGVWDGAPLSLAAVTGLPRLRTLTAYPGTLADPLQIAKLSTLEFLALGPDEWRVLLDAGAVPRSLSAAAITVRGQPHPLPIVAIANELLALWNRPAMTQTILEGDLGPEV